MAGSRNRSSRTRWRALPMALLFAAFASAAWAQGALGPSPPVFTAIDQNGVDVIRGDLNVSSGALSIGRPGAGGLAYSQSFIGSGWRHNYVGTLNQTTGGSRGITVLHMTVSIGETSEEFTSVMGTNWFPVQDTGSSLTFDAGTQRYTFRTSQGSVAVFDKALAGSGMGWNANEGRIVSLTHPNGETLTYHYVSATLGTVTGRRLQSVTNSFGYQLHFEYANNAPTNTTELNGDWQRIVKVTAINNAVDYCSPTTAQCTGMTQTWPFVTFTHSGSTETITDAEGRATRFTYASGRISAIRRPSSTGADHLTYAYTSGRVSSVSNGSATWTYAYADASGNRTTTVTNPLSQTRVVTSVIQTGLVTSDRNGVNQTTAYEHDANDRITRITAPEGNRVDFSYDARGNLTLATLVAKSGSGLSNITMSASYDGTCANIVTCNQPNTTTDERGNVTNYQYNSTHGGIAEVTAPDPDGAGPAVRPQTRFAYQQLSAYFKDAGGAIVAGPAMWLPTETSACATTASCANGADETRTLIAYGANGVANNRLPVSATVRAGDNSLSALTSFTYDAIGNALTVDGPLSGSGDTTRTRYNAVREPIGVIGPDPDGAGALKHRATRISYNGDGQVTLVEQGTVDSQSDAAWANFAPLQQVATSYDFIGRETARRLQAGATTFEVLQSSYNAANRLECMAQRMNPAIFAALPASACSLGTEGANGPDRIVHYTMDNAGRVTQVRQAYATPSAITERAMTYTANGQIASLTDAGGNVAVLEYDGHDRAAKLRFPNATGGGTSTTDFEQYSYDAASNLTQLRRRDAATLSYTYDALNRLTLIDASSNGADVSYTYDNFGRQLSAAIPGQTLTNSYDQLSRVLSATSPQGSVSYQWDIAGRRTRVTWPDAVYVSYEYDLTNAAIAIHQGGVNDLALYAYDNLGRRTGVTRGSGAPMSAYAYDAASRLTQLVHDFSGTSDDLTLDFTHDAAGGMLSRTLTSANTGYAFPPPSPASTAYADNGLNQYTSVGGAAQAYDARGNLTSGGYGYDIYNRLITGPSGLALSYDAAGRLYESASGGVATRFLYDGAQLIGEYDASNALLRRFVPGPALDDAVAWYEGNGTGDRRFLLADERGSVVAHAGAGVTAYAYDAYGQPSAWGGLRLRYAGALMLPEAQAYHMRARAYAPGLGRFLQTDPILHQGGMNLYAYVGNDPMNFVDPWGLYAVCRGEWPKITCRNISKRANDLFFWIRQERVAPEQDWEVFMRNANDVPVAAMFEIMDPGRQLNTCEREAMASGDFSTEVLDTARLHNRGPMGLPMPRGAGLTLPRTYLGGSNIYVGTSSSQAGGLGLLGHELTHSEQYANGTETHWSILGQYFEYRGHDAAPAEIAANERQERVERALGGQTCPTR